MSTSNKYLHFTLEERRIIQTGITNGSTQTAIAKTLGKSKSAIGKEIKKHRSLTYRCPLPLECDNYRKCAHQRKCTVYCTDYKEFRCTRRDRSPGACNGCDNIHNCRFNKYKYSAGHADTEYRTNLVDSRAGIDLTTSQVKELCDTIGPLLRKGQSPYQIVESHPELGFTERTLYNYINQGVFSLCGIGPIDLRRQVSMRRRVKPVVCKKREDRSFLQGRTYKDYLLFLAESPSADVLQMDTVYNDRSSGPFLQTFKFVKANFLFAILHEQMTSSNMNNGVLLLESILGADLFRKHITAILTDRGGEFANLRDIEADDDGVVRTRIFYCDPMNSSQKGSVENKHRELRYILPKQTDLRNIGLTSQNKLNIVLSHVNSVPLESLNGRTGFEALDFFYHDIYRQFLLFGLCPVNPDDVILKPYLIK